MKLPKGTKGTKQKAARGPGKDKKPNKNAFTANVKAAMIGEGPPDWPPFPHRFHALVEDAGSRMVLEERQGRVVTAVKEDAVVSAILKYCEGLGNADLVASFEIAKSIMLFWKGVVTPVQEDDIHPVLQLSERADELCWHRLPFDFAAGGDTPTFDEFFSRVSNAAALQAWVGGLFDAGSDMSQYVWLYGAGENGKSRFAQFLYAVFGPSYRSEQVPAGDGRFWSAGLIGSRVVVFPDCTDHRFVTTGRFKSLTGADVQRIERKGKDAFYMSLKSKFMFLSNERPLLSGSTADRRRAIYCETGPLPEGAERIPAQVYDRRLWDEAPAFLAKCVGVYTEMCRGGGAITTEMESLEDLIEANEEPYADIVERYFMLGGNLPSTHMQRVMRQERMDRNTREVSAFYEYLLRTLGVKGRSLRTPEGKETRKRVFDGIQLKPDIAQAWSLV